MKIEEYILHTGQHYDKNMNEIMSGMTKPTWQLHCGGIASHSAMMAEMLVGIESALLESFPDYVLVYGDTNSTLAGALAASHLNIPVIHVEAGLRSFNRRMPEEKNRVLTDHLADLLFCPTYKAVENLAREGITEGLFHIGDVMYDAALMFGMIAEEKSQVMARLGLKSKQFSLCTVHRAENTNDPERLQQIIIALRQIARPDYPVVLPLHPRTAIYLNNYHLRANNPSLHLIEPVDYQDMVMLEKHARVILTDSGGVQKEAYFHRTPCVTLRDETEWVETVEAGWNQIAGCSAEEIIACHDADLNKHEIKEYGDGHAADKVINAIVALKR